MQGGYSSNPRQVSNFTDFISYFSKYLIPAAPSHC